MSATLFDVPVRPNGIILWRAVVSASKPPPGIAPGAMAFTRIPSAPRARRLTMHCSCGAPSPGTPGKSQDFRGPDEDPGD
jgi:hypothetical protein